MVNLKDPGREKGAYKELGKAPRETGVGGNKNSECCGHQGNKIF